MAGNGIHENHLQLRNELRELIQQLDDNPATLSQRLGVVDRLDYGQLNAAKRDMLELQRRRTEFQTAQQSAFRVFDSVSVSL